MTHRNGRPIYGVSFADLIAPDRNRRRVTPCTSDAGIVLRACGAPYGAPLDGPECLSPESLVEFDAWMERQDPTERGEAYHTGYEARIQGELRSANPCPPDSWDSGEWSDGWDEAPGEGE